MGGKLKMPVEQQVRTIMRAIIQVNRQKLRPDERFSLADMKHFACLAWHCLAKTDTNFPPMPDEQQSYYAASLYDEYNRIAS